MPRSRSSLRPRAEYRGIKRAGRLEPTSDRDSMSEQARAKTDAQTKVKLKTKNKGIEVSSELKGFSPPANVKKRRGGYLSPKSDG